VWAKSNPNLGISKRIDSLRSALVKAKEMPSDLNNFLTKELDIWTSSLSKWVNRDKWDACGKPVDLEALIGRSCFAGLDLSSTTDISALVLVFPPETEGEPYRIIPRFWIPESNMNLRSKRDGVPYEAWNRAGLVSATPGDVIDHDFIVAEISELAAKYKIEELAFDRWGSVQLVQKLQAADMKVIQYGQGFATMGPAMKTIEEMILSERLAHGNNAPLNWMADNLVVRSDPAGNLKPDKAKSTEKIDGMVALIMALDRAVRNEVIDTTSIYEKRGMRTL
jgi:phage terminase large subunit-like protein